MVDESVGEKFDEKLLQEARDRTLAVIEEAARQTKPGMTESDAKALIKKIQAEKECPKFWHAPQIRFGENTLQPFGKGGKSDVVLQENDIFFYDLGPLFEGHEGDVGRAYAIGGDPEMKKCAEKRGWVLTTHGANGHRIADFPHAARHRGTVQGLGKKPSANRWILEVQIRHPSRLFGAFYEDLLN